MATLTQDHKTQLLDHGYVVVNNLIDDGVIERVREEIHDVVDHIARGMHAEGLIPEIWSEQGFDRQLARIAEHDIAMANEVVGRIHGTRGEGGHMGPAMFDLFNHPGLLDAIEVIVGPEIIGSSVYRIRPKAPGLVRGAVPWHQDSGYLLGHCDRELIVTCWVPLVDANEANGCLHVIPDVHRHGIRTHHTGGPGGYLVIKDEDFPEWIKPIPVPVQRGGVLFLTNLTPHSSYDNNTDIVRWSVDLRYQNSEVPHNVGKAPGEIDPDAPDVEIACYPPEADFVLRNRKHPEKIVRTWRHLKQIRDDYFDRRGDLASFPSRWTPVDSG
jgi:hypothetical protein